MQARTLAGGQDHGADGPAELLGRTYECQRLDELLAAVRAGGRGSMVLRGEAGIGKTTLLEYARDSATGMLVLRAQGVEFESELAFAGLYELVRPVLGFLDQLPAVQADALRVAFAVSGARGSVDRWAVYGATLGLLAMVAETTPVLCLVDDAHWLDRASGEALLFATRRLLAEPVAIVFAARDAPGFAAPGVPELLLAGLDLEAGIRLATRAGMSAGAAAKLVAATAGNPLAVLELPATLTEAQRRGRKPLDPLLHTAGRVEAAFLAQTRSLAEDSWRALVTCAACDTGELAVLARALQVDGLALPALDPAVTAGLLAVRGDVVSFRHPLVRSAVYSAAGPGQRQAAHRAAAAAFDGAQEADRRAWHLAAAALDQDEQVAAALVETAERALQRGGVVAEARAYERAARLSPDPQAAAQRLLKAALARLREGAGDHAAALLEEVVRLSSEPAVICNAEAIRAHLALLRGDAGWAGEAYIGTAESYAGVDPIAAGKMMSVATNHFWARMDIAGMLRLCLRVDELTAAGGDGRTQPGQSASLEMARLLASVRLATAQVLAGLPEGSDLARSCIPACAGLPAIGVSTELAECLIWIEEHDAARRLLDREIDQVRGLNEMFLLAYALPYRALLESRAGRLHAAHSAAVEGVQIAEQVGHPIQRAHALAIVSLVEAQLGAEADCRDHAGEARRISPPGLLDVEAKVRYALGVSALSAGRPADAVTDLEWVDAVGRGGGVVDPGMFPVTADLAECYTRLARTADAALAIDRLEQAATRTGRATVQAVAARCRGLLAADDAFEAEFHQALALHDAAGQPLERARTLLCHGQRLRRAKRRRDAREQLYAALAVFQDAGAAGWARQCQAEIDATGRRTPTGGEGPHEPLTIQEWQIAQTAAEGLTNREIATRVYLSPKTVEYHLGNIYRKLGLRSRHELARHLARSRTDDAPTTHGGSRLSE